MKPYAERLYNGIVKENPVFVLMLGICPTLAVTTSAINGLGMGLSSLVVLAISNLVISLLRNIIPDDVRLPAFIVIVASFVTVVELLMEAYLPSLYSALGIYIPLIVVNCIILGRAEAYASKNPPLPSLFDGIGMGLGFTHRPDHYRHHPGGPGQRLLLRHCHPGYEPMAFFVRAPGAFLVLAILVAIMNASGIKNRANKMTEGCDGCCAASSSCDRRRAKQ